MIKSWVLALGEPYDRNNSGQTEPDNLGNDYPYLTWAGSHHEGLKKGKLSDRDYPLTWEAKASQAD